MAYAYSTALWTAAHTAALAKILAGAGTPKIRIRDSGDVLLAEAIIDTNAANSKVETSGAITLAIATQEDAAPATGTASYAQILDADGTVHAEMDCQQGSSPVSGYCVMNTLSVVQGAPVEVLSVSIAVGSVIA